MSCFLGGMMMEMARRNVEQIARLQAEFCVYSDESPQIHTHTHRVWREKWKGSDTCDGRLFSLLSGAGSRLWSGPSFEGCQDLSPSARVGYQLGRLFLGHPPEIFRRRQPRIHEGLDKRVKLEHWLMPFLGQQSKMWPWRELHALTSGPTAKRSILASFMSQFSTTTLPPAIQTSLGR